jgi:hypothetical protein
MDERVRLTNDSLEVAMISAAEVGLEEMARPSGAREIVSFQRGLCVIERPQRDETEEKES